MTRPFILALAIIALLTSCNPEPKNQSKAISAEEVNKEIVLTFINSMWNMQNLDTLDALVVPTYVDYAPSTNFEGKNYTPETLRIGRQRLAQMMPDLRFEIEEVVAEGGNVVVFATGTFTHTNPTFTRLGMAEPTHKKISYKIVFKYTVENGKIVKGFDMHDMYNRCIQMGLIDRKS